MTRAQELLSSSETATTKWFLSCLSKPWDQTPLWEFEEERLLLFFQYVSERLPAPDNGKNSQKKWEEACDDYLEQLSNRVYQGDARAQRISAALDV